MIVGYRNIGYNTDGSTGFVTPEAFFRHICALRTYEVMPLDLYDPGNAMHVAIVLVEPNTETLASVTAMLTKFTLPFTHIPGPNNITPGKYTVETDEDGRARLMCSLAAPLMVRWMNESDSLFRATVAVIITNYNYAHLLQEAVESVDSQIVKPDEFIIVDDASTDGSHAVLDALETDGRTVIRNPHNLGIVENFRSCVARTTSDYILFLGADNRLRSDYILECRLVLDANFAIAVAYTDILLFGVLAGDLARKVGAKMIGHAPASNWNVYEWRFPDPTPEALATFRTNNFVHGSSMYRRSAYDRVGGYRAGEGPEDHNLFYRIWEDGGGLAHVALPLLEYRQHSVAQANNLSALQVENAGLKAQIREWTGRFVELESSHRTLELEVGRLNSAFAQSDAEARRIAAVYAEQETELRRVHDAYVDRNAEVSRISDAYGQQEAALRLAEVENAGLKAQIRVWTGRFVELESSHRALELEVGRLNSAFAQSDAEARRIAAVYAEQETELRRVHDAYVDRNAEVSRISDAYGRQEAALRLAEAENVVARQALQIETDCLAIVRDDAERQSILAARLAQDLLEARRRDYLTRAARWIRDVFAYVIRR